jgi:hypothetical protein
MQVPVASPAEWDEHVGHRTRGLRMSTGDKANNKLDEAKGKAKEL